MILLTGPGNDTAHVGPQHEVLGREREKVQRPKVLFIGTEGGGLGLFIGKRKI